MSVFGLGKDSPIDFLRLSKPNFEAMLARHGQRVRWRMAKKCVCVLPSNRPNPHCERCGGTGELYDYQKDYIDTASIAVRNGIAELALENENCEVLGVTDAKSNVYEFKQMGRFVQIVRETTNKMSEPNKLERNFDYALQGFVVDITFREAIDEETPLKFFVLSQNLSKADSKLLDIHSGDAVCTFPYKYDVGEGDIITVLSGSNLRKVLLKRAEEGLEDALPDYFVSGVASLETEDKSFVENIDFVISKGNKILWMSGGEPPAGAAMAVTYKYLPTFRVYKNIPQLRTSEDQRMPKKVILKLFSAYQETRGIV